MHATPVQKSHQVLLVTLGRRQWLVDLGFGGNGLLEPVPLEPGTVFPQFADGRIGSFEMIAGGGWAEGLHDAAGEATLLEDKVDRIKQPDFGAGEGSAEGLI